MGLHDVDKDGQDRLSPSLNQNDEVTERYAHGTVQNHNAGAEATSDGLKFLERQIIARQGGANKAVFGFFGEANKFGLKVAEDGVDVLTADDDELLFNSEQNVFKVVQTNTHTVSYSFSSHSGSGFTIDNKTDTIAHNLGFVPAIVVFVEYAGGKFPVVNNTPLAGLSGGTGFTFGGGTGFAFAVTHASMSVDSTNLYLGISRWGNLGNGAYSASIDAESGSLTYRYYLLQETAN